MRSHTWRRSCATPGIDYVENKIRSLKALDPFFEVVQKGLAEFVDGEHYFDTIADDAVFEFLYYFPGWPKTIRGRADLMAAYSGYGKNIVLHRGDGLVVHPSKDGRVVTIEYEVHGKIVKTGASYDNRLIAVVTIETERSCAGEIIWTLWRPGWP